MSTSAPRYRGSVISTDAPADAGRAGRAWLVPLIPPDQRRVPDHQATVASWLCDVPGAHRFWNVYSVGVLHLRPIDGVPAPIIRLNGATHELFILAVDPEAALPSLDGLGRGDERLRWLSPPDVMQQFIVGNDAQAYHVAERAVHAIVNGLLSPDQGYRRVWEYFVLERAERIRAGLSDLPRVV